MEEISLGILQLILCSSELVFEWVFFELVFGFG